MLFYSFIASECWSSVAPATVAAICIDSNLYRVFWFLRATAYLYMLAYSAYMARQFRLSVRLSVTRVICVKTAERIIEIVSPSDRRIIRPPVRRPSNGRTYKMLVMFFLFFQRLISELPRPITAKLRHISPPVSIL